MRKKILCIHQGYELYGSDRSFIRSVKAIRKQFPDIEITIVLPQKGVLSEYLSPYINNLEIRDLGIIRKSDFKKKGSLNFFNLILKILTSIRFIRQYDFLYINSIVALGCIFPTLFLTKPISVIHVREIPTGMASIIFSVLLRLSHATLIFNSQATKSSFHFIDNERSHVIYNGVREVKNCGERTLNHNKLNILLLGRFNSWKGHIFFLNALNQLDKKYLLKISVRFVGDYFEDQKQYLEDVVRLRKKFCLESVVSIHPFAEDPSLHYDWAHIVIVPSTKPEPFGLVAIEAMSAYKPVIGSNHGGLAEIIVDNKTGFLIEPNNQEELNESIIAFIENPNKVLEFGNAGRKQFEKKYHEHLYIASMKHFFMKNIKSDYNGFGGLDRRAMK